MIAYDYNKIIVKKTLLLIKNTLWRVLKAQMVLFLRRTQRNTVPENYRVHNVVIIILLICAAGVLPRGQFST